MKFGNKNNRNSKVENIFHTSLDHGSSNENTIEPLNLTLIPSISNRQIRDNESVKNKEETLEVLNICT